MTYKGANDHTVPLSASGGRPDYFNSSVIVAMITVGMMQVTFHQIIDVIPVRDRFVTAASAVLVRCIVAAAGVLWRANVWVFRAHCHRVLIHVTLVGMMKMPVVKVIDVSFMLDGHVPTIGSVDVIVAFMGLMFWFHAFPLSL